MSPEPPVDAVVTWVKRDAELQASIEQWRGSAVGKSDIAPNRFRANGELEYCVKAIRRYLPWIRTIYILTNGQQPPAAVMAYDNVVCASHDDAFQDKSDLPTFNSNAIEANVGFLPTLSEHFIMFNDDFFIGRELSRRDFFTEDGTPVVRLERVQISKMSRNSAHQLSILLTNDLIDEKFGAGNRHIVCHTPVPLTRTIHRALWRDFPQAMRATSASRFRSPPDVTYCYLVAHYLIATAETKTTFIRFPRPRDYKFVELGSPSFRWRRALADILWLRPQFFCLNDDIVPDRMARDGRTLSAFLKLYYDKGHEVKRHRDWLISFMESPFYRWSLRFLKKFA